MIEETDKYQSRVTNSNIEESQQDLLRKLEEGEWGQVLSRPSHRLNSQHSKGELQGDNTVSDGAGQLKSTRRLKIKPYISNRKNLQKKAPTSM